MKYDTRNISLLTVTVCSREGVLFEGAASSVSSVNDTGPFDILPQHENFVSIIRQKIIIRDTEMHEVTLKSGVLKVRENRVEVYVGI